VNHFATPDFWSCYRHLPDAVRELADKNFALLRSDPHHPSLRFKQIGAFYWPVSGCITARWPERGPRARSGSGSADMVNTSGS
jgi:hypothetical protein